MPNDAKLGLLVGVIGVIAVAVVSANRPAPAHAPIAAAPAASATISSLIAAPKAKLSAVASTPGAQSTAPVSTPIARTRIEATGTPASLTPMDDIDP